MIRDTLDGIFEETGKKWTVSEVAVQLGTTRKTLLALLNGNQPVTPELAIRLGTVFPNTTPEFWQTVQENYEAAPARR